MLSAWRGRLNALRALVQQGGDADAVDASGFSHDATATHIHTHTTRVNKRLAPWNCRPLLFAAWAGHAHVVRYLLRCGVDREPRGERTPEPALTRSTFQSPRSR